MIWIAKDLTKDYAWELSAFHVYRSFSDGISFFEFNVNWDRFLHDHSPKFDVMLVILNCKVFEFNIYYKWHRNEDLGIDNMGVSARLGENE